MEDWGEIELVHFNNGTDGLSNGSSTDFWSIMDELYIEVCNSDGIGFWNNRGTILDAYSKGKLYGLRVDETDEMFKRGVMGDPVFCRQLNGEVSWYLLPCFCVKEGDEAILLWTHTRARRRGFAKKLVELLEIKSADWPLPESLGFWQKCGIDPYLKKEKEDLKFKLRLALPLRNC